METQHYGGNDLVCLDPETLKQRWSTRFLDEERRTLSDFRAVGGGTYAVVVTWGPPGRAEEERRAVVAEVRGEAEHLRVLAQTEFEAGSSSLEGGWELFGHGHQVVLASSRRIRVYDDFPRRTPRVIPAQQPVGRILGLVGDRVFLRPESGKFLVCRPLAQTRRGWSHYYHAIHSVASIEGQLYAHVTVYYDSPRPSLVKLDVATGKHLWEFPVPVPSRDPHIFRHRGLTFCSGCAVDGSVPRVAWRWPVQPAADIRALGPLSHRLVAYWRDGAVLAVEATSGRIVRRVGVRLEGDRPGWVLLGRSSVYVGDSRRVYGVPRSALTK